jgi:hypothetical protein
MFYLLEILGVFLQNTIIFGGFRASSWGILKISSGNTGVVLRFKFATCYCAILQQNQVFMVN